LIGIVRIVPQVLNGKKFLHEGDSGYFVVRSSRLLKEHKKNIDFSILFRGVWTRKVCYMPVRFISNFHYTANTTLKDTEP
jgi:hypothetical protein